MILWLLFGLWGVLIIIIIIIILPQLTPPAGLCSSPLCHVQAEAVM